MVTQDLQASDRRNLSKAKSATPLEGEEPWKDAQVRMPCWVTGPISAHETQAAPHEEDHCEPGKHQDDCVGLGDITNLK